MPSGIGSPAGFDRVSPARRCAALALAGLVALPAPARAGEAGPEGAAERVSQGAADPRAADVPLAVPLAEPAAAVGVSEHVSENMSQGKGSEEPSPETMPEGPSPPPNEVPAPGAGLGAPDDALAVAVGLGPSAPGTRPEQQLVDALERAARASAAPRTQVRRLRPGVGEGRQVCRERRDDLVILVEYLPDRPDPVLLAHDCRLDRPLGIRGGEAAAHPELVAALWAEHDELVRQGAQERRRGRLGPKARTGLIAGGAILAVGVAIGFVVAASLRREVVVLTVSP